jgi:hypothetical protein
MALIDKCLAYYKLEEADTVDKVDSKGLAVDLMESGSPDSGAGKIGNGTELGGYGGSGAGSSLLSDTELEYFDLRGVTRSFSIWFYADDVANSPGIVSNWGNPGGDVIYLLYYDGGNLNWSVRRDAGDGADVKAITIALPGTDQWVFCVCGRNSVTQTSFFSVNGGAFSTLACSSVFDGTSRLCLGSRNNGAACLNGIVDCFGMWNAQLSDEEVDLLYNGGAGLEYPFPEASPANGSPLFLAGL